MNRPLVSIGIPVFNGQNFLAQTLDSFLAQDYENFEVIILDNISADDTQKICQSYAKKDSRIRYFLDDTRVDVMEGHKRVSGYAKGEFYLIACDDDVYAPSYISKLMNIMLSDPKVGLVYSGLGHIYPDGTKGPSNVKGKYFLRNYNSKLYNFAFYLLYRCPVPLSFGLIKTELHKEALKYYYRVDHRAWDHDNLYMLRLLSLANVDSTREILFYWRQRNRSDQDPEDRPNQFLSLYIYLTKHQVLVSKAVAGIINKSGFNSINSLFLHVWNVIVLVYTCTVKYFLSLLRSAVKR